MAKSPKFNFQVDILIQSLLQLPFITGIFYVKWIIYKSAFSKIRGSSLRMPVKDHKVNWNQPFDFQMELTKDKNTGKLSPFFIDFILKQEFEGGTRTERIGEFRVNLSELLSESQLSSNQETETTSVLAKQFLLQKSKLNSYLKLIFNFDLLTKNEKLNRSSSGISSSSFGSVNMADFLRSKSNLSSSRSFSSSERKTTKKSSSQTNKTDTSTSAGSESKLSRRNFLTSAPSSSITHDHHQVMDGKGLEKSIPPFEGSPGISTLNLSMTDLSPNTPMSPHLSIDEDSSLFIDSTLHLSIGEDSFSKQKDFVNKILCIK